MNIMEIIREATITIENGAETFNETFYNNQTSADVGLCCFGITGACCYKGTS